MVGGVVWLWGGDGVVMVVVVRGWYVGDVVNDGDGSVVLIDGYGGDGMVVREC